MAVWAIKCFRNQNGKAVFLEEYKEQSVAARANLKATLNGLRFQPTMEGWCRPNGFDRLTGKKYAHYHGLGKLRFKTMNIQHRPLGFFGPFPHTFTLLVWATERDGKFDPPGVLDRALSRMQIVKQHPGLADDFNL